MAQVCHSSPLRSIRASNFLRLTQEARPGTCLMDDGWRVVKRARATIGCVSPRPCRSEKAEALLLGPIEKVERQLAGAGEALADCFCAALAKEKDAELYAGDPEFRAVAKETKIVWL